MYVKFVKGYRIFAIIAFIFGMIWSEYLDKIHVYIRFFLLVPTKARFAAKPRWLFSKLSPVISVVISVLACVGQLFNQN